MPSYVMYASVGSNPAQLKFSRTKKVHNSIHDSPNMANARSFARISPAWNVDPTSGFTLQAKKPHAICFLLPQQPDTCNHFLLAEIAHELKY